MISSKENDSLMFLHYVEDCGLSAYNRLVTHNIDHVWNEKNKIHFQEKNDKKRKQEEAIKRGEEVFIEGKQQRMGSMSMPAPTEHMSPPHQYPCTPGFSVRSQSLHSVGVSGMEEEEGGSPTSRKLPPPKPRRDPSTKLSISSEAVDISPTGCKIHDTEGLQGCGEDCRKVPPPKPKRNPNTQLSISFDESFIRSHSSKCTPTVLFTRDGQTPSPQPLGTQDPDEPVYIEMSGTAGQEPSVRSEEDEPGEAVYEEMKYPTAEEFDSRWDLVNCRSLCVTPCPSETEIYTPLSRCSTPRGISLCDIPAPFPNLLSHRPPLLVFPPVPAQRSPNSDESPLTPLDVGKIAMFENGSCSKSSPLEHSGTASMSHMRRAERELTATPTITASGRSSAPPLPCALYKTSSSSYSYQRSHSACPSPVSMGRCLTPLSLMRSPPIDGPFSASGLPRSASATPHGKASPPHDSGSGGRHHGSMQNVSVARSRTPTSPLDELTNLFTTGRNMLKKNTSGRKSKEPGESESKGKSHSSESKREHKERSHHKESKRDKDRSSNGKSSHRRDSKDRELIGIEGLSRHDYSHTEALIRRDSKDKGSYGSEVPIRQDSQDRGVSTDALPRRNSKDRGFSNVEPLPRLDSKDRGCVPPDLLPRQDSKELIRNGLDVRRNSREKVCYAVDSPFRHESKDLGRTGLESRRDSKDGSKQGIESSQDKERSHYSIENRRGSKERINNGNDMLIRRDCKERGVHKHEQKDRTNGTTESPKAQDKETRSGYSSNRSGRSSMSPNPMLGNPDLKTALKEERTSSSPIAPSPKGTPQKLPPDVQQMPPMPWLCGDSTMMEMIEKKQRLCREIRSRRLPDCSPCKKESLPVIPTWKKTNGLKKYSPPPYPTQTTVFWDTAI